MINLSGIKEAVTFVDIQASYEAYEVLEILDEKVDLLWVMASRNSGLYACIFSLLSSMNSFYNAKAQPGRRAMAGLEEADELRQCVRDVWTSGDYFEIYRVRRDDT